MNPAPRQEFIQGQVPAVWEVGDVILDLYEVRAVHEGGGMGLVYRVFHRSWNMDLAVKSPRPELFQTERQKEDFLRECETWVKLGLHPHVASCYYIRNLGGIPRIFAEYVEGGTLRDWIDSQKLYEGGPEEALRRILDIAIQMAWGLHYAHEQGVIHQDVKPANVLMAPDGTAKVTDFGLAKARAATSESACLRQGQTIFVSSGGMTPAYCSPEQAQRQPLSGRSDIWSWAVTVLEMFAGEVCWTSGVAAPEVLRQLDELRAAGLGLPKLPEDLQGLLIECFESNPAERPKDASEIARRLGVIYHNHLEEEYPRSHPVAAELRADALNNRALSLLDLGKPEEALAMFEQALALEPSHAECLYNRALLLWRRGKLTDQAVVGLLRGAIGKTDNRGRVTYVLGLVHLERGDNENAARAFEAAGAEEQSVLQAKAATGRVGRLARISPTIRIFTGHGGHLNAVSLTADGRWALSASQDTLRLWEVASGRCVRTFAGHTGLATSVTLPTATGVVTSVTFSTDGRWALSGGWDKTVRLWEVATGKCLRVFEGHMEPVTSVALSANGRLALSASEDKTLRLWELVSGRCLRVFEGHTGSVTSAAVSADGRWALSGSWDGTLRLWEVATGRCLRTFAKHAKWVSSVALTTDACWAVSGSGDATLLLWELVSGRCLRVFEGHMGPVTCVALSAGGRWALSGAEDRTLRLWELQTGRCLRTFEGHTHWVTSVALTADGRCALSGGSDNTLRLWELVGGPSSPWMVLRPIPGTEHNQQRLRYLASLNRGLECLNRQEYEQAAAAARQALETEGYGRAPEALDLLGRASLYGSRLELRGGFCRLVLNQGSASVWAVALSGDGRWALSGNSDSNLWLWDVTTGQCLRTFAGHNTSVDSVALSADGRWTVSGSPDNTVRLWELATGRCLRIFEGHTHVVNSVALSASGRWVLSGSIDRTLRLWELATGRCLRIFEGHADWVNSVALTPDDRWALSGGRDKTLRLWEVATGRCVRVFRGHTSSVDSLAVAADGRWALSGSQDKTLRLWDIASGCCLRTFKGHTGMVTSVAVTADGRWALSGGDNTLRLWDLATGHCLQIFEGHTNWVTSVALRADGRWVLSGSEDATLRLWELDWECEFPSAADWEERAQPYLEIFLTLHCPAGADGFTRGGQPEWTEEDFQKLLVDLRYRGFGWLRPEGVRRRLLKMAEEWWGPPPLLSAYPGMP